MKPRDWMRLVVPGLCVGMLPACFNPAMKATQSRPFTGQPGPKYSYGPRPVPGYAAMPQPMYSQRQLSYWNPQLGAMQPVDPFNQLQTSANDRATSPYLEIRYGPYQPYLQQSPGQWAVNQPQAENPDVNAGSASLLPDDPLSNMIKENRQASNEETASIGPLTLPEPPAPDPAAPAKLPPTVTDDSFILTAMKSSMEKRPEALREALRSLDPAQRELLMALIPLTIRVGEGGLTSTDPHDVAVVVDQLQGLLWALRPRAALVMDKFCFCQRIEKFGKFKKLEGKPTFRPGEMVEVYAEIRNVSSQLHRSPQGDFQTHLRSKLQIRNQADEVLFAKECDKPDETLTPQHDYFQHYRLRIPSVRPGTYVLNLEAEDVPTGRKIRQKLEFEVTERD